jgi:hypothetical protein
LAVPRSMPMSRENNPMSQLSGLNAKMFSLIAVVKVGIPKRDYTIGLFSAIFTQDRRHREMV